MTIDIETHHLFVPVVLPETINLVAKPITGPQRDRMNSKTTCHVIGYSLGYLPSCVNPLERALADVEPDGEFSSRHTATEFEKEKLLSQRSHQ